VIKAMTRTHVFLHRLSGGRLFNKLAGDDAPHLRWIRVFGSGGLSELGPHLPDAAMCGPQEQGSDKTSAD
jgi:hypothetical protein